MMILAIYWKSRWQDAVGGPNTGFFSHTAAEQVCFDRRMAQLRRRNRRFGHLGE